MWTIYALVDPRTSQIRYIGQTQNHPEVRLMGHLEKDDGNKRKRAWLDELRRFGEKPVVVALEYAPSIDEALEIERLWIRRGNACGWPLLNHDTSNYAERYRASKTVVRLEKWYRWTIDNYLPTHPELLQTDDRGRGMGVKALAETMAAENGKGMDAMKGTASEVAKRLRADVGFVGGAGEVFGVNDTGGKKGGA